MSEPAAAEFQSIRFVPVDQLFPYVRNARTHSDAQVAQIAASIREFGWTNPVLVAENSQLVAGHGRVLAARVLYQAGQRITSPAGVTFPMGTVPVIDCVGWSDAKRRAYILADNQLALNAGWDEELLRLEVKDLKELAYDLPLIGFSESQLHDILAGAAFDPTGEDEQSALDSTEPKIVTCPHCGETFDLRNPQGDGE